MNKTETLEQFLARGGQVNRCPVVNDQKAQTIKSVNPGPVTILSLSEADLLYGEKTERKKKEKKPDLSGIDMSHIPEELKVLLGL